MRTVDFTQSSRSSAPLKSGPLRFLTLGLNLSCSCFPLFEVDIILMYHNVSVVKFNDCLYSILKSSNEKYYRSARYWFSHIHLRTFIPVDPKTPYKPWKQSGLRDWAGGRGDKEGSKACYHIKDPVLLTLMYVTWHIWPAPAWGQKQKGRISLWHSVEHCQVQVNKHD